MKCSLKKVLSRLSVFLFLLPVGASADVQTDFDGDGKSDVAYVKIESDKSLTWKAISSLTSQEIAIGSLGKSGDSLAPAKWLQAGQTLIGVVSASGSDLVWKIKDSQGNTHTRTFGKAGDVALGGAYINDNDLADAIVVRKRKGRKGAVSVVWEIAYDLFNSTTVSPQKVTFGKSGDRVFFSSLDGRRDALGVVRKAQKESVAIFMNPLTLKKRTYPGFPGSASTGDRPRPFPLAQPADGLGNPTADALVFQSFRKSNTTLNVFDLSANKLGGFVISGKGIAIAGDFNSNPGEEIAFENPSSISVLSALTNQTASQAASGQILFDEINANLVNSSSTTPPSDDDDSGSGGGSGGGDSGGGSVNNCQSVRSWPGSHIYKTKGSTHFSPGDVRRNTIGLVIKTGGSGPFPGCVDAVDREGNVVARLGLYSRGDGWAARYYAGVGCGSSTPYGGSAVASRARSNTGSSAIYMNMGSVCYGPIDASDCVGSSQC